MKKPLIFLLITLTLFSLKTHANSSDKKHYVSADMGVRLIVPYASLRYGRNLYSKAGDYLGFVEAAGTLGLLIETASFAYLSLIFGYEYMRDKKFSLGLIVFGEWGKAPDGIKKGYSTDLHPGTGAFVRIKITENWSGLLKLELPFGDLGNLSVHGLPSLALGARYHF